MTLPGQWDDIVVLCLAQGEALLDVVSKTTPVVAEEYAHYTEGTWSSKGMLELIRQKMSSAALDSDDKPSTSTSSPLGAISIPSHYKHVACDRHQHQEEISLCGRLATNLQGVCRAAVRDRGGPGCDRGHT